MPNKKPIKEVKRLMLNIPQSLYDELAREAADQRRSVTGQLIYFVESCLSKQLKAKDDSKTA
mgnify:CR=1 FL=1